MLGLVILRDHPELLHGVLRERRPATRVLADDASGQHVVLEAHAVDTALDAIYGALFFRLLLGHAPLDTRFVKRLLDVTLRGLRAG